MNTKTLKIFILKFIILALAHSMFAVLAWLLGNMLGAFNFDGGASGDETLKRTLICAVCGVGFFVYMGRKIQKSLSETPDRSNSNCAASALFDTAVFAVLLLPLPIASFAVPLYENAIVNRIYAPHMLPNYLGLNGAASFLIWLALYFAVSFLVMKFAPPVPVKASKPAAVAQPADFDEYSDDAYKNELSETDAVDDGDTDETDTDGDGDTDETDTDGDGDTDETDTDGDDAYDNDTDNESDEVDGN